MKHTYLGPSQATFSALAHAKFSELFRIPRVRKGEELLAERNEQVVPLIAKYGGFGVIAMETEAEGRIDAPINSFVRLMDDYKDTTSCPVVVIAAMRMPVSFVLMARAGVHLRDIKTIIAHPKALGACKNRMRVHRIENLVESDSNGKAAEEVASNPIFAQAGALGPEIAVKRYGLEILEERCEDQPATTTFFLLGSLVCRSMSEQVWSDVSRSLLVFRVRHEPGSLVKVLAPFSEAGLNLRQIHSYYIGDGQYDFAVEVECGKNQAESHARAMSEAKKHTLRHILFGPFPVL